MCGNKKWKLFIDQHDYTVWKCMHVDIDENEDENECLYKYLIEDE